MEINHLVLLLFLFIPKFCVADHFTDVALQLPECGVGCILNMVPRSVCQSVSNTTCLCTDDDLHDMVFQCVQMSCSVLDAIETARVEADACQRPQRSRKRDLLAVISIETLAFLCAMLRLYSRWYTVAHFEMDDYIMIGATILYVPFEVLGQIASAKAFGVDIWNVDAASLTYALKLFYISESLYLAIIALTKLSILCFYLRIFPNPAFRRFVFVVMIWVAVSALIFMAMQIFQCTPVNFMWEGWKGDYGPHSCVDINKLVFTAAGFSIAQDVVILFMPLPLLAQLQTSWRVKLGAMVMFSLGIFVVITSCVRLGAIILFARSTNPTWDYTDTLIWTGLECAVSIIVASLPAIRVLLSRLYPKRSGRCSKRGWPSTSAQKLWRSNSSGRFLLSRDHSIAATRTALGGDMESQIELGDKTAGDVSTEIGAERSDGRSNDSTRESWGVVDEGSCASILPSPAPGIHVWKTTRTTVWRN